LLAAACRVLTLRGAPALQAICDKTAQFVARNGAEFEKRILANEATNQKFNFLKEGDPYNAYYRKQVGWSLLGGTGANCARTSFGIPSSQRGG
jgi:hypothetical protein